MLQNLEPHIVIEGHRIASPIRADHRHLTGARFFAEAGGENARRVNIRRVRLSNDPNADRDLAPGQTPTTPYALLPTYEIGWYSILPTDFTQEPSSFELAARREAQAILQLERGSINEKTTQDADDLARLAIIKAQLAQLADNGLGYVGTIYDAMGTKAKGVWYGLAVGNVPIHWKYTKGIRPDRSISVRLKRLEAPPRQGTHEYALILGDNDKRYALVVGKDKEIQWRHYRPMKAARREGLELQLHEALDAGRLTAADETVLAGYDAQHAQITDAAKGSEKTPEQTARLLELKRLEERLRDDKKRLNDAARELADEIRKELYYEVVTVAVPEFIKTTVGVPLDITIEWLRRGGALITVGNNEPFVWFDSRVKKSKKYGRMLNKGSRLEIKSTGGKWSLALGAPIYSTKSLAFSAPYTLAPEAAGLVVFTGDCSPGPLSKVGEEYTAADLAAFPGVRVTAKVVEVSAPLRVPGLNVTLPGLYQTRLIMFSGGDYAAEVHNLEQILVPAVPVPTGVIYDSDQHRDQKGVSHFIDLQTAALEANSVEAKCIFRDGLIENSAGAKVRESGLPFASLVGRIATVSLAPESGPKDMQVWRGRIAEDSYDRLQSLSGDEDDEGESDLTPMPNAYAERVLTVTGMEQVAAKLADAQVSLNGLELGPALRLCASLAGFQPEEYALIPDGPILGIDTLPLAALGELPTIKPDDTTTWLQFMRQVVKDHAPTYELATGDQGLYLRSLEEVNRPDLEYSEDAPSDSNLRLLKGLSLVQNLDDFANRVVVIGAEDETTKKRIQIEERLTHSTDPRFEGRSLVFVGDDFTHVEGPNDSIDSDDKAHGLGRKVLDKKGRPPLYGTFHVPYRADVKEGQLIYNKGRQFVVTRKERGHINSGEGVQVMDLSVRLCSDKIKPTAG